MEGIGLDNMLGAEEVEKMFSEPSKPIEETTQEGNEEKTNSDSKEEGSTNKTAEVDFSDFIGVQPESVGSEKTSGSRGETPKSDSDSGTPNQNLFSSIAKALRDEGVFPDLSDETINGTVDAASLKKMFDDEVGKSLDERQRKLEKAMNGGATSEELQDYQKTLSIAQYLDDSKTYDALLQEGEDGEKLRKQVMYQDYINRGFKEEKAIKMIEKSLEDGSDIEDAKEALESCKEFYHDKLEDYQQAVEENKKRIKENEEKQYANLKKHLLDPEEFFGGVKVDKSFRQKAYDSLTKPVYKDSEGNYLTALQKYQRENPVDFMENVAMLYSLTDGFKSVENLTKGKVKAGLKKGFAEFENLINSSKRNGDGTLNLANSGPDEQEREKWTLAL